VQEIIKGKDPGPGLRLRFNGGRVAGATLSTGVAIPQPGEQGIYFVRSISKPLANPLVGWAQGHFTISDGNEVIAGNGAMVTDIQPNDEPAGFELSEGLPRGFSAVRKSPSGLSPIRGLTPEEFKYRIRELVELRRNAGYRAAEPASREPLPAPAQSRKDPAVWASETAPRRP